MTDKSPCTHTMEQICDILEFQLGHEVGREACQEVMDHVKNCPKCCAEIDSLKKTIRIFKQEMPSREVPKDVQWRLLKELHLDIPAHVKGISSDA